MRSLKRYAGYGALCASLSLALDSYVSDRELYRTANETRNNIVSGLNAYKQEEPVHYYVPLKEGNAFKYVDFGNTLRNPEQYRGHLIMEKLDNGTFAFIVGNKEMIPRFFGRAEFQEALKNNTLDPGHPV